MTGMRRLLDIGLERLTDIILEMASMSEKAVDMAIEGYVRMDTRLAEEVYQLSNALRMLQEDVAELATELIARYQPVASDLRYIRSCMEIAYGFSRFGRYAYDIIVVLETFGDLSHCDKTLVRDVGNKVRNMIMISVNAFKNRDVEAAEKLRELDDEIDNAYSEHIKHAISNSESSKNCDMAIALILRYLERIADHATYIGESVSYIVTGERAPRR